MKNICYLYKICNTINQKLYIGVTANPKTRWSSHRRKDSKCIKLRNAMVKYGSSNFSMVLLCKGEREYVLDLEKECIQKWNTIQDGYNIDLGGRGISKENLPDRPVMSSPAFISGFWFPNVDTALEKLKISIHCYRQRKNKGVLGDTEFKPRKCKAVYFHGFWYPSIYLAHKITGYTKAHIHRTSEKLELYDTDARTLKSRGYHKKVKVMIDGILYDSIKSASQSLGIAVRTVKRRIERNTQGYEYYESKPTNPG